MTSRRILTKLLAIFFTKHPFPITAFGWNTDFWVTKLQEVQIAHFATVESWYTAKLLSR